MLKEHLRIELVTGGIQHWDDVPSETWSTVAQVQVSPPGWASRGLVFATSNIRFGYRSTIWYPDGDDDLSYEPLEGWFFQGRLVVNGTSSPIVDAYATMDWFEAQLQHATVLDLADHSPVRLEQQVNVYKVSVDYTFFDKTVSVCNPAMLIVWQN